MMPAKSHQDKFYQPGQDDDIFARTYGENPNARTQVNQKPASDGFFSPDDERPLAGGKGYNLEALDDISEMQMVENLQETALAEDDNKLLDVLVRAYAEVL